MKPETVDFSFLAPDSNAFSDTAQRVAEIKPKVAPVKPIKKLRGVKHRKTLGEDSKEFSATFPLINQHSATKFLLVGGNVAIAKRDKFSSEQMDFEYATFCFEDCKEIKADHIASVTPAESIIIKLHKTDSDGADLYPITIWYQGNRADALEDKLFVHLSPYNIGLRASNLIAFEFWYLPNGFDKTVNLYSEHHFIPYEVSRLFDRHSADAKIESKLSTTSQHDAMDPQVIIAWQPWNLIMTQQLPVYYNDKPEVALSAEGVINIAAYINQMFPSSVSASDSITREMQFSADEDEENALSREVDIDELSLAEPRSFDQVQLPRSITPSSLGAQRPKLATPLKTWNKELKCVSPEMRKSKPHSGSENIMPSYAAAKKAKLTRKQETAGLIAHSLVTTPGRVKKAVSKAKTSNNTGIGKLESSTSITTDALITIR